MSTMSARVQAALALVLCALWALGKAASGLAGEPGRCVLSQYRSLDPEVLAAVRALRNGYEEEIQRQWPRDCSSGARRTPPPPSSSCARMRHVARAIADAQAVLSSPRSPAPLPGTGPTLELLAAARRDLEACLRLIPPRSPRTWPRRPGRRRAARRAVVGARGPEAQGTPTPRPSPPPSSRASPRCHEFAVIFSLLRTLTEDLRAVANAGPCV